MSQEIDNLLNKLENTLEISKKYNQNVFKNYPELNNFYTDIKIQFLPESQNAALILSQTPMPIPFSIQFHVIKIV